jgi:polysaccharide deacetylase 2 family uncharacterized protein YibQ
VQESLPPAGKPPVKHKVSGKKKKQNFLLLFFLLGAIAVLLVVVEAILPRRSRPPVRLPEMSYGAAPATGKPAESAAPRTTRRSVSQQSVHPQPAAFRRSAVQGKLIFVIDDVGNNVDELRPFLEFPGPLTLSIMPQRRYTLEAYRMILKAGKFPMLHQPMQADGNENPGAGVITTSMSKREVEDILRRNLEGMGKITWVNNHEGSKATSNIDTMTYILSYLTGRGIHFLDSRTSPDSAVKAASLRLGLPYYKRNSYFLDNTIKRADILKEIDSGLRVAQKDGFAVMIGHVWDRDLARILIELYPRLTAEGYRFGNLESLLVGQTADVGFRD